jgi:hypothetical protein
MPRRAKPPSQTWRTFFQNRLADLVSVDFFVVPTATFPSLPSQNPFAEGVIGTLRRELLDHVIVLNEGHLRRRLCSYLRYYHASRTHLALQKDAPEPRAVEPPEHGQVVALPQVGGLHHRYVRRAA